jgi:hypothetical protein
MNVSPTLMAILSLGGLFPAWPNTMIFDSADVLALAGLTEMIENSTLANKNPNNTAEKTFFKFFLPRRRRPYS